VGDRIVKSSNRNRKLVQSSNRQMVPCLFCKIVSREIPAAIVFEDDRVLAFNDINPQASTHVLVVPKLHIATLNDLTPDHDTMVGELVRRAAAIAAERGIQTGGYRTVFNTNRDAGQTVFHIHLHLIGGRSLAWPPG
jgi:histidine triad (HIT) family protein